MVTALYLVRHGEADESADSDPALNERGTVQARAVGQRLAVLGIDCVLHSSRRRARETAAIAALSLQGCAPVHSVHADDRTPIPNELSSVSPSRRAFLASVPVDERDEDGRCLDQSIAALGRVEGAERRLLVVTHNFVIGWFVCDALGAAPLTWMRLNSANGALTIICYSTDEPPRLIAFNDTGHLRIP